MLVLFINLMCCDLNNGKILKLLEIGNITELERVMEITPI